MKKTNLFVVAIVAMMVLSAGVALAGDANVDGDGNAVGIDLRNETSATGGNADARATGGNAAASIGDIANTAAGGSNSLIIEDQREFLQAPGYGRFVNPGTTIQSGQWQIYCPPVYRKLSMGEVESMKRKFQGSDIFPWNWKSRIHSTILVSGYVSSSSGDVYLMDYWPKAVALPGDKVLATTRVLGDPNWPEEAFLGMGAAECRSISGASRMAMRSRTHIDGVTVGKSIGLGGAGAKVSSNSGVAFAAGGQLGNNRTKEEDYVEFEILCMNDAPPPPEQPVVEEELPPTPAPVKPEICDPEKYRVEIERIRKILVHCKKPCFNNELLRKQLGDAYRQLFECLGRTDCTLIEKAIEQYQIAERDFQNGKEPDGIKTSSTVAGQELIVEVYNSWADCVRELADCKSKK
ncbi:MAG: hypothetical protein Q8L10_02175 [Candidatus Moranbacteria bacterium]|nr:hypothetical protein [Candidatus Moranbacteria bacterium]